MWGNLWTLNIVLLIPCHQLVDGAFKHIDVGKYLEDKGVLPKGGPTVEVNDDLYSDVMVHADHVSQMMEHSELVMLRKDCTLETRVKEYLRIADADRVTMESVEFAMRTNHSDNEIYPRVINMTKILSNIEEEIRGLPVRQQLDKLIVVMKWLCDIRNDLADIGLIKYYTVFMDFWDLERRRPGDFTTLLPIMDWVRLNQVRKILGNKYAKF
uniref:Uncharacterized protein n=1 Tax=Clastoptera arizonana TaxID=38151 RepID=A0A1B6DH96_9HEMI